MVNKQQHSRCIIIQNIHNCKLIFWSGQHFEVNQKSSDNSLEQVI